jgi:hypothetical protein
VSRVQKFALQSFQELRLLSYYESPNGESHVKESGLK